MIALNMLQKDSSNPVFPDVLAGTDRKTHAEFADWADRASARYKANEQELREIVDAMATAVESLT